MPCLAFANMARNRSHPLRLYSYSRLLYPCISPDRSCVAKQVHGCADFQQIPVGTSPTEAYNQLVRSGAIRLDQGQMAALQPLERLHRELRDYKPTCLGFASSLLRAWRAIISNEAPRGVYLYGGVGTGKSLVADIFYHCTPVQSKRRVHFHQFMLDVHKRMHEKRLKGEQGNTKDVVESVAQDLLEVGWLLCFDEFQVVDIADAMILRRLLESFSNSGAVMVASSNRAPFELYKNGLQRELFLPCIKLIEEHSEVHSFHQNSPDYRLIGARPQGSSALSTVWHMPVNRETSKLLEEGFAQLAGGRPIAPTILKEGSRSIPVPRAAGGIAFFTFTELCGTPKGASDYLAIASSFHTLFLEGIFIMNHTHNEMARRFITLIDILYEQKVKLIVNADVEPKDLYQPRSEEQDGETDSKLKMSKKQEIPAAFYVEKDEEFAFARTVSRLNHMQSSDYLSAPWAQPGKAFICHLERSRLEEGDLQRVWDRYNVNGDAQLSRTELTLMMEDITEIKSGHRNVPEELLDDMYQKLDLNGDGIVVWPEFRDYFLRYGLEIQSV